MGHPVAALRRLGRREVACLVAIVAGLVLVYVTNAVTPELLGRDPQVLELLDGSTAGSVTAGAFARVGRLPLALAALCPLIVVVTYDVFYWWAGRLFGERALAVWSRGRPRAVRWVARGERVMHRYGVLAVALSYYLPVPSSVIQLLAGSGGMPLAIFLAADAVSCALWYGLLVGLGYALGHPAVRVVDHITHYALLVSLGVLALLLVSLVGAWRRLRAADA